MKPGKLKQYINSIDLQNHKRTEAILQRVVSQYLSDPHEPFKTRYELQEFNSKEIERMLTMFENSRSGIRKLSLVLISLVLMNSQSKIFFLEKCGLSLVTGKTFLTRLKYVSNFSSSMLLAFRHMQAILGELKQTPVLGADVLFWYIPLDIEDRSISDLFLPRVRTFRVSDIKVFSNVVDLSYLPDPVFNLCGVEFSKMDQRAKMMAIRARAPHPFSHSAISHTRKGGRSSQINSSGKGKDHGDYFQYSTRSTVLKSKKEYSKYANVCKKEFRHSAVTPKDGAYSNKIKMTSNWGGPRKSPFDPAMPLKSETKARNRDVRRHIMMGPTGAHMGRTSKVSGKQVRSPYTKRKTFKFNGGGISSMQEVLGEDQRTNTKEMFGSRVYAKKKGRSTYGKLHLKNSRKSAKG